MYTIVSYSQEVPLLPNLLVKVELSEKNKFKCNIPSLKGGKTELTFELQSNTYDLEKKTKLLQLCPSEILININAKNGEFVKKIIPQIWQNKKYFSFIFDEVDLINGGELIFSYQGAIDLCHNFGNFSNGELHHGSGFIISNIKLSILPPAPCDNSQAKFEAKLGAISCVLNDKEHIKAFVQLTASGLSDGDYMLVSEQTDPKMIFSKISVKGGKIDNLKSELCQIKTGEIKLKFQKSDCKEVEASLKAERPNDCDSLPPVVCEDCKLLSGLKTYRKEDSLKFYSDLEKLQTDCAAFTKLIKVVATYERYQDKSLSQEEQNKLAKKSQKNKDYAHAILFDSLGAPKDKIMIIAKDTRNSGFEIHCEVNCVKNGDNNGVDKVSDAIAEVLKKNSNEKVTKVIFYFYIYKTKRGDAEYQRKSLESFKKNNEVRIKPFLDGGIDKQNITYQVDNNPNKAMIVFFSNGVSVVINKDGSFK